MHMHVVGCAHALSPPPPTRPAPARRRPVRAAEQVRVEDARIAELAPPGAGGRRRAARRAGRRRVGARREAGGRPWPRSRRAAGRDELGEVAAGVGDVEVAGVPPGPPKRGEVGCSRPRRDRAGPVRARVEAVDRAAAEPGDVEDARGGPP